MKILKKVILIVILAVATVSIMTITAKAATVKVTGDVLNIRKGPSTDTDVVAMISKGVECEMLGEEGNWYKIKYKNYTGYISKDYSELVNETSTNQEETQKDEEKNNIEESNTTTADKTDTSNKNTEEQNETNTTSEDESNKANQEANNNQTAENDDTQTETKIIYKKFNKDVDVKILPLIHSSKIGNMKKNTEVLFITETLGWSYIQSDTISGWVRSDTLGEEKIVTTNNSGTTNNSTANNTNNSNSNSSATTNNNSTSGNTNSPTTTEKTAYISEEYVNLRKGAGTSYNIIKVLTLNTELTILKEEGDWYQVKTGSSTGYVSKEFVSDSKKVTNRDNTTLRTENRNETIIGATDGEDIEQIKAQTNKNNEANKTTSVATQTTEKSNTTTSTTKNSSTSKTTTTTSKNTDTTKGTDIVAYAKKYLGHKYVYGGDGSNGTFDCSGFTMYVFNHFGTSLPHSATAQYKSGKGTKISKQSDLKTGDIVFLTDYETGEGIGHCGIYIDNGNFIHASTTTYSVIISSLNTTYKGRFYAGLRLI